MTDTRRCSRCHEVKPRQRFSPNPRMGDGLSSWCRDCASAATRAWRARVRDTYNAARRVSYPPIECGGCGVTFTPRRTDSRYCCALCRDHRRRSGRVYSPVQARLHWQLQRHPKGTTR
ncbi:MAG: hypothetical protein WEB29_04545 [Chloroflexota bacterium]